MKSLLSWLQGLGERVFNEGGFLVLFYRQSLLHQPPQLYHATLQSGQGMVAHLTSAPRAMTLSSDRVQSNSPGLLLEFDHSSAEYTYFKDSEPAELSLSVTRSRTRQDENTWNASVESHSHAAPPPTICTAGTHSFSVPASESSVLSVDEPRSLAPKPSPQKVSDFLSAPAHQHEVSHNERTCARLPSPQASLTDLAHTNRFASSGKYEYSAGPSVRCQVSSLRLPTTSLASPAAPNSANFMLTATVKSLQTRPQHDKVEDKSFNEVQDSRLEHRVRLQQVKNACIKNAAHTFCPIRCQGCTD